MDQGAGWGTGEDPACGGRARARPRFLLLEDNEAFARAVTGLLRKHGDVTVVGTVCAAVHRLGASDTWDAFVFDIGLPDGSGLDMLRLARAACPDAVALAISGSIRSEDIDGVASLGAHFLAKPFKEAEIVGFLVGRRRGGSRPPRGPGEGAVDEPGGEGTLATPAGVDRLPEALAQLAADARAAGARVGEADAEQTYRLGLLARAVSARGDAGITLEACAQAARVSRQTLQEFVTLTTRWEPSTIVALLKLVDRSGRVLSRTGLLQIARGSCATRRAFDESVAREDVDLSVFLPAHGGSRSTSRPPSGAAAVIQPKKTKSH